MKIVPVLEELTLKNPEIHQAPASLSEICLSFTWWKCVLCFGELSLLPWDSVGGNTTFYSSVSKRACLNEKLTPHCIILTVKKEALTRSLQDFHHIDVISKASLQSYDGRWNPFFFFFPQLCTVKKIFQVAL